jgi:hypothetical protein
MREREIEWGQEQEEGKLAGAKQRRNAYERHIRAEREGERRSKRERKGGWKEKGRKKGAMKQEIF